MAGLRYTEMRESIPVLFSGILEGAKRIKNIVNSLKDFARADTSDLAEAVDINAVTASAITLLGNHIKKSTKRFEVQYGERIPMLKGNFQRLEQVIVNLVQNACEALSNNQEAILLTTSYDPVSRRIIVKVMDEGIGIPEQQLQHIMEPFNTTKRHKGGVGLGLAVSYGIIRDHEGSLHFTSKVGEGTTATISIPVSNGNDVPAVET